MVNLSWTFYYVYKILKWIIIGEVLKILSQSCKVGTIKSFHEPESSLPIIYIFSVNGCKNIIH